MLGESHDHVVGILTQALARQTDSDAGGLAAAAPATMSTTADASQATVPWSGWPLVQRRIRLLQADAVKIIVHSEAIVRDVA
jgi:hypothetical protein